MVEVESGKTYLCIYFSVKIETKLCTKKVNFNLNVSSECKTKKGYAQDWSRCYSHIIIMSCFFFLCLLLLPNII